MPWIDTGQLTQDDYIEDGKNEPTPLDVMTQYWLYNGLDCAVTWEVNTALDRILDKYPECQLIYKFERAMQAPALDMMRRGFKVDQHWRAEMIDEVGAELKKYEGRLNALAEVIWGRELNGRSPPQLKAFFKDWLRIPIPITRKKGEEKESLDRKVLEKLYEQYFYAKPIISHILAIRDKTKTLGTLRTGIDSDGRFRTSFNVAATETGRWSSSENAFGTGGNLQNITERIRRMFIADDGYKLAYIDLEQAEARVVALLVYECLLRMEAWCAAFGFEVPAICSAKELYLDACESGDLHTTVSMLTWPELGWSTDEKPLANDGNHLAYNRRVADDSSRPFYRDFTYRDIAKRLGHGSNYRGSPFGIAQVVGKIEAKIVEAFQKKYFAAFPIESWHKDVVEKVQLYGVITTPLGRRRQFFGRRYEDATHREAIAYQPQSMVGDLLNLGLWRIWNHYKGSREAQLLAQIHDAVVIQYIDNPAIEKRVIETCSRLIQTPVQLGQRTLTIPNDVKVGWNFAKADPKLFADGNPDGLKSYKGQDDRRRSKALGLLDRPIR